MSIMRRLSLLTLTAVSSSAALADAGLRADSHAPIGVMGDHVHQRGEWMLSYRYMLMEMDGNLDGSSELSSGDILDDYRVAPDNMTMVMHMLGAMYAPSDDLTLMAMVPLLDNEMDHVTRMGGAFTTETDGVGDVKLSGLYRLRQTDDSTLILNLGLSLPTGSIDEEDVTGMSMGNAVQLPYPMQLGSGTYDLRPGITYTARRDHYSWGAQGSYTYRLGENDNDYTLGDRFQVTAWYARPFARHWSWSLRGIYSDQDSIDGADSALNPMMRTTVPTADPDLQGGERIDVAAGLNWAIPGSLTNRLALEVIKPVYQDLDGPQMEADYTVVVGWQLSL